jgi:hypothetical protein
VTSTIRFVGVCKFSQHFYPLVASAADIWAETPGLNDILPGPQPEIIESTLLAKEK